MDANGKLAVEKGRFEGLAGALEDIRSTGYWPSTYVSGRSPELPLHYHDHDIIGYVISGETYLLDENRERVSIGPGDRLVIPQGAWHAEGEVTDTVTYLVSVREPVSLMEAVLPREPQGPFPTLEP